MPKGTPKKAPKIGRRIEMNEVPTPQTAEEVLKQAQTPATMEEQEKLKEMAKGQGKVPFPQEMIAGTAPSLRPVAKGYVREVLSEKLQTIETQERCLKRELEHMCFELSQLDEQKYFLNRELFGARY
jgi:hypothetical protein